MAIALVWSDRWPAAAQSGAGRVSGTVRLTMAGSAPSGATVYGGRSVAPRAKAQPEIRNVVVFFCRRAEGGNQDRAGVDRAAR
ncbi:MAG: hypothetical protein Q7R30_02495 [Acidobacteriota bacterium]|nr:hypothetical protein [Acidobacteriota bacterium]